MYNTMCSSKIAASLYSVNQCEKNVLFQRSFRPPGTDKFNRTLPMDYMADEKLNKIVSRDLRGIRIIRWSRLAKEGGDNAL